MRAAAAGPLLGRGRRRLALRLYAGPATVLCPGAVATAIIDHTEGSRPGDPLPKLIVEAMAPTKMMLEAGTSPDLVGEMVLDAIRTGRLHVLTDNEANPGIAARAAAIVAAAPDRRAG